MDNRNSAAAQAGVPASSSQGEFRIRYGRCAIALVGLTALVTALLTGVLLALGHVSGLVPAVAALLAAGSVALLRTLAVRERRVAVQKHAEAVPHAAAASESAVPRKPAAAPAPVEAATHTSVAPFDAESGAPEEKPFTAEELRAAALAVATEAGDYAVDSMGTGTPWQPVEIPKPVYVDAAKAERPAPAPLDLPEAPKATSRTPLKQPAAVVDSRVAPAAKSSSALSNLDDVLQRRRA